MKDFFQYYHRVSDGQAANWVVAQCTGPRHSLHTVVPTGFEAYARIEHPYWRVPKPAGPGNSVEQLIAVPCSEVPPAAKAALYPGCGYAYDGIEPPLEGELSPAAVQSVFAVLGQASTAEQPVYCGIWEGFGYLRGEQGIAQFASTLGQEYLLFQSTLAEVEQAWQAAWRESQAAGFLGVSGFVPNALWPADRAWYLAVPFQATRSYLAGSQQLVQALYSAADLEVSQAEPLEEFF